MFCSDPACVEGILEHIFKRNLTKHIPSAYQKTLKIIANLFTFASYKYMYRQYAFSFTNLKRATRPAESAAPANIAT